MTGISASDLRLVLRFLDIASAACGPEPLPRTTLAALADLIPADDVSYFELRRGGRERGKSSAERAASVIAYSTTREEPDYPWVEEVAARFAHQNPVSAVLSGFGPASGAVRQSEVVSRRTLEKLDWYHYYLKPLNLSDTLKVWLHSSRDTVACVSLERSEGDFSERETVILGVLQTHLATLRRNALAREGAMSWHNVHLTPREADVLIWALRGKRNDEIGQLLFIATGTVKKHLEHAYEKLGVRSRAEALTRLNGQ